MAFFEQFPKLKYDTKFDGIQNDLTDIFRYVDVIEDVADDIYGYSFTEVNDGERPDQLSQRLYGTPDYYWTFFITNDRLKNGLTDWPKSSNELDDYINYLYGDEYGVISVPDSNLPAGSTKKLSTLIGGPLLDTKYKDDLYLVATDADDSDLSPVLYKIVEFDEERYQLWLDITKSYDIAPGRAVKSFHGTRTINTTSNPFPAFDDENFRVHLPFEREEDLLGLTTEASSYIWNNQKTQKVAAFSWNPVYISTLYANVPTWDSDEQAWEFDGVDDGLITLALNLDYFADSDKSFGESDTNYFGDSDSDSILYEARYYNYRDIEPFTIAFFIKTSVPTDGAGSVKPITAGYGTGSASVMTSDAGGIIIADGKLSIAVLTETDSESDDSAAAVSDDLKIKTIQAQSTTLINDNEWHHCIFRGNGDKTASLFVDGALEADDIPFNLENWYENDVQLFYEYFFSVGHLMSSSALAVTDSDSSTSDDDMGLPLPHPPNYAQTVNTPGYLRDFRIYDRAISDDEITKNIRIRYTIDAQDNDGYEDSDGNIVDVDDDIVFGWDKRLNHYKEFAITYQPYSTVDSDSDPYIDDWESDVAAFTDIPNDIANRLTIRAYDYWKDSALAPYLYTNKTISVPVYFNTATDSDTPQEVKDITITEGVIDSDDLTYREDYDLEFTTNELPKGYVFYIEGTADSDGTDSDSKTFTDLQKLENYIDQRYIAPIIGDGTAKTYHISTEGLGVLNDFGLRLAGKRLITTDSPFEVSISSQTSDTNYYYVNIRETIPGYRYVLYHNPSTSVGGIGDGWQDNTNAAHIVDTGSGDNSYQFIVDRTWDIFETGKGYFKVFAFPSKEISDDSDAAQPITAYDALGGSTDLALTTEKDGWWAYRNPDYVTNKQLEVDRNTENSFIKTVKTGYIGEFADNYRALINR